MIETVESIYVKVKIYLDVLDEGCKSLAFNKAGVLFKLSTGVKVWADAGIILVYKLEMVRMMCVIINLRW